MPGQRSACPLTGTSIDNDTRHLLLYALEKLRQGIRPDNSRITITTLNDEALSMPSTVAGKMHDPRLTTDQFGKNIVGLRGQ